MFTSRRNHLHKTQELTKNGDPEALIFLYQLTYVSIHNELLKQGYSEESVREKTILDLIAFWEKHKAGDLAESFVEAFERDVVGDKFNKPVKPNEELRSYLEEKLKPSVRSNIWSKSWSIVSGIIVFLACIGWILNECGG